MEDLPTISTSTLITAPREGRDAVHDTRRNRYLA